MIREQHPNVYDKMLEGAPRVLSNQENFLLGERISHLTKTGDNPKERETLVRMLTEGNLRLVGAIYREHPGLHTFTPQEQEDLISTAHEELVHSAQKYNPWHLLQEGDVPFKTIQPAAFSSFAVTNMYLRMLREMRRFHPIWLPNTAYDAYRQYSKAETYARDQFKDVRSDVVVAVASLMETGATPRSDAVDTYFYMLERSTERQRSHRLATWEFAKARVCMNIMSLDDQFFGSIFRDGFGEIQRTEVSFQDVLPSDSDPVGEAEQTIRDSMLRRIIDIALPPTSVDPMTQKKRKIIELYYGQGATLEQIASYYGETLENIRLHRNSVISRLRHPKYRRALVDFLDD